MWTSRSFKIVKYIFPVVIGAITLLACIEEFRGVHEKHALVIKEELSLFIDTVKGITLCQAWIPGKEGEPIIYFINGIDGEETSAEKMDLIVAGEKELKIVCHNHYMPIQIDDTLRIPYRLIDYVEYQSCNHSHYVGQDITLFLSSPIGQHMIH
jgi:hypothetical protein